jgi:hypothetical protein
MARRRSAVMSAPPPLFVDKRTHSAHLVLCPPVDPFETSDAVRPINAKAERDDG